MTLQERIELEAKFKSIWDAQEGSTNDLQAQVEMLSSQNEKMKKMISALADKLYQGDGERFLADVDAQGAGGMGKMVSRSSH